MLDFLLIGGGLANGILALQLAARQPRARFLIVERAPTLGEGHTWSFHGSDVSPAVAATLAPAIAASVPGTEVRFPGAARAFQRPYHVLTSPKFDQTVRGVAEITRGEAVEVSPHRAVLRDGRSFEAELVVDARGPERGAAGVAGFQKFVGLELRLARPHGLERALLMDATVEQRDGFRFVYLLPLAPDVLLVEDTYYSDSPALDGPALRASVLAYAAAAGLDVAGVEREERGVLPLPSAPPAAAPPARGLVTIGYQGGFLHPTTGYSLPVAARVAETLAGAPAAAHPTRAWDALLDAHRRQARFAAYLNRLLFFACAPGDRREVLARFYRRLPDDAIARFYALDTRAGDRLRILCGRPPRGMTYRAALAVLPHERPPGRDA